MTHLRLLFTLLLAALIFIVPMPARAGDHLDIQAELLRPGTRVLAIEFYATWCKPCMEAVPRWKALHDKYRDKGLRLVVVAVQDDGRCENPGWSPDAMVCDEDGRFSQSFKIGGKLPAAFLWSWTGKMLVQRGHVDEVASAIDKELAQLPRVTLSVRQDGPDAKALSEVAVLLRSELRKSKKLEVVANQDERAALDKIRRESQKSGYSESSQCKMGEELAANSLLKAEISHTGKDPKLVLQLFSAEQGCLTQSGMSRWHPDAPDDSVADAVADLLQRLRVELQMPAAADAPRGVREKIQAAQGDAWKPPSDDAVLIAFESMPSGARVEVDGQPLCNATPCKRPLGQGDHRVRMSLEKFVAREEAVRLQGPGKVAWTLAPNTARVRLETGLSVPIRVDGEDVGTSPLTIDMAAGPHRIELASPCHQPAQADVVIERGVARTVTLNAVVVTAGLRVELQDEQGEPVEDQVKLDGASVGQTWQTLQVPVCGREVAVGRWREPVALEARKVATVRGRMEPELPPMGAEQCRTELRRSESRRAALAIVDLMPGMREALIVAPSRRGPIGDVIGVFDPARDGSWGWYGTAFLIEAAMWSGLAVGVNQRDASNQGPAIAGWTLAATAYLGLPLLDYLWVSGDLRKLHRRCDQHAAAALEPYSTPAPSHRRVRVFAAPQFGAATGNGVTFGFGW